MRIDEIRLGNFKLFNKTRVGLRPLTLLTGTNSSGKTTVLNAIGAVLQTRARGLFPLEFTATGANCSLGSFRDILRQRSRSRQFSIGVTFSAEGKQAVVDGVYRFSAESSQIVVDSCRYQESYDGKRDAVDLRFRGDRAEARVMSARFGSTMTAPAVTALVRAMEELGGTPIRRDAKGNEGPSVDEIQALLDAAAAQQGEWFSLKGSKPNDVIRELRQHILGNTVMVQWESAITSLGAHVTYVGPVRAYPERYYLSPDASQKLTSGGREAVAILYYWKRHTPAKFAEVVGHLRKLELIASASTKASLEEVLRFDVRPFRHKERVSIADVGFGVSQILPVLVADVGLPEAGVLMVNQPEVHLHPSSQALFANYMVSRLADRQYIVETHSEYLINRLRRLRADGLAKREDVLILFADVDKTGTPVFHQIEIDDKGALVDAPSSFFDTYYMDAFAIATSGFDADPASNG